MLQGAGRLNALDKNTETISAVETSVSRRLNSGGEVLGRTCKHVAHNAYGTFFVCDVQKLSCIFDNDS